MPAAPRRRKEWFDDDAFWQDVYPFLFTESRFADAVTEVDQILGLLAPSGRAVLDLACGPGRTALALARQGYAVTGVDRTRYFLNKARTRARAESLAIEWVQADMRDFVRPGAFDVVLSLFTSFGYFNEKREDLGVLRNVHASLRPGGAVLIDVLGKEVLARIFRDTVSTRLANGSLLVQRHEVFEDWTRVRAEWVVVRKGRAKNFVFHHTIYSGQELRQLLQEAGFVDVTVHGSLAGEPYGRESSRLVVIGRKAADQTLTS